MVDAVPREKIAAVAEEAHSRRENETSCTERGVVGRADEGAVMQAVRYLRADYPEVEPRRACAQE